MIKLILAALFMSNISFASRDCDLILYVPNATVAVTPSQQIIQQVFGVSRSRNNDKKCKGYTLFFNKGQANSYQRKAFNSRGESFNYNLHSNINMSGILKDVNDALSANEKITGQTPEEDTVYFTNVFMSVSPGTLNPVAGIFTDNVQVSYYSTDKKGDLVFEGVTPFSISVIIPTNINIGLVDEGGGFDPSATTKVIDFGNLEENSEMGVDLMIMSNTPYQIRFSSLNNGVLKSPLDTFNYQMRVNSSPVNLAGSAGGGVIVASSGTCSSQVADRYNIKVKLTSDAANKTAGLYQDIITITAIAN